MRHYPPPEVTEIPEEDDVPLYSGPSKSQRKRDMTALQDMGSELAELPKARLKKIDMPEALLEALLEYQRLTKHEARRRQMQYIGKLLRGVEDVSPMQEALDIVRGVSAAENAKLHHLEKLRERLLADEKVLGEIAAEHPEADMQQLRQLRRNALKEQEQQRPPKAFREIFQVLKELREAADKNSGDLIPDADDDEQDAE